MVDVEKRYLNKPWLIHDEATKIKDRLYNTHLPPVKPSGKHSVTAKHRLPHQSKRDGSNFLPALTNGSSPESSLVNGHQVSSTTFAYNSSVHEAANRYILHNNNNKNNMARFSQELSSIHFPNSSQTKRKSLYNHIQSKINTGLPHIGSKNSSKSNKYQLEPIRPVNWVELKNEIEQDIHIYAHTKQMQFNSDNTYKAQLTTLGNLVRSKVKAYLSSSIGSDNERYKIVVSLTVYSKTSSGLHVASRCLWNTSTDNSITIKMQGVDCNIIIVVFLCYTDLGVI
ncbi:unnamed protein product [Rotaria sordida]|uniref:Uncharacterized protein n=1 Tax=Rotaria sordida TaxID=392033 RepID=A0A819S4H9_9BILA|nr:unnamed protein product [Rotaria sordida]CAF1084652.1 unnamed protein product [Rotaria sordida]CAF1120465.1 unnamed protein product [Rotaria sordida]CAF1204330.1 unnamed protein product [Rotaria sordida]CAF4009029.1 unnamed protein product [Rotaria sordida]